jgi:hypothetical protein
MNFNHISAVSLVKGEIAKPIMKQIKAKASLQEFHTKLQALKELCHFFENTEIEGYPEEDTDNLEMLEELADQAENSQYEGVSSALYEICDDILKRKKECEERADEKAFTERREYESMIMSCETHLNPRISTFY